MELELEAVVSCLIWMLETKLRLYGSSPCYLQRAVCAAPLDICFSLIFLSVIFFVITNHQNANPLTVFSSF